MVKLFFMTLTYIVIKIKFACIFVDSIELIAYLGRTISVPSLDVAQWPCGVAHGVNASGGVSRPSQKRLEPWSVGKTRRYENRIYMQRLLYLWV